MTIEAMRATPILRHVEVLPSPPTIADGVDTLGVLEHLLRPLAVEPPGVDLCHTSSNGLCSLVAMAAKWTHGTPFLLTEHGIYLRERYIEYAPGRASQAQRSFLLGFYKRLVARRVSDGRRDRSRQ